VVVGLVVEVRLGVGLALKAGPWPVAEETAAEDAAPAEEKATGESAMEEVD